jgi:Domain of unknown function (DUF6794)
MRIAVLIFFILFSGSKITAQMISSTAEVITTYSQNGRFFLKSIPFDNVSPSLRGRTYVYEKGNPVPLYVFERGFDSVGLQSNNLILSNNGEVIFYAIPWGADEKQDGLKSVSIYHKGRLIKSYSETEITRCDKQTERCSLTYSNYDKVVDKEKSQWGTANYRKVLKEGVDEKERFLSDFAIFSFDDTMYLTDSKKVVHLFDLKDGNLIRSEYLDPIFNQIKGKGRFVRAELQSFAAPTFLDFPKLQNGKKTNESLAALIGMKTVDSAEKQDGQYKCYSFKVNGNLSRDGRFEIETIDVDPELPQAQIIGFFRDNKFDDRQVPKVCEKWNIDDQYFFFRKKDDEIARQEKQQEKIKQRQEYEKRLTLEIIEGVYIPRNVGECFIELDKMLKEVERKEMEALPKREEMILYHHGLGTWLRNNWGLWGGSRLQRYFLDKGINHPDEMSSIILFHYYDWLNGRKESWKDWEKNPSRR